MENMDKNVLSKKDVMSAWGKWQVFAEMTHSYERMEGIAVATAFGRCLEKIYAGNKEGYIRALQRHLVFFNTQANWGGAVLGAALAMEEKMVDRDEDEKDEAINGLKTGLMGPLAGIGDAIDWGTLKPVICGLGVSLALAGNIIGVFICLLFDFTILFIGRQCWWFGYQKGASAMSSILSGKMFQRILKASGLLATFMMGVLTASYVALQTTAKIPTGDSMLVVQDVLDGIIPGVLPLAVVLAVYYILKNKSQKFGWIAIGMVIVSILLSVIGIV